jgi:hypothetical protein
MLALTMSCWRDVGSSNYPLARCWLYQLTVGVMLALTINPQA